MTEDARSTDMRRPAKPAAVGDFHSTHTGYLARTRKKLTDADSRVLVKSKVQGKQTKEQKKKLIYYTPLGKVRVIT
jgi:hypothetical protein